MHNSSRLSSRSTRVLRRSHHSFSSRLPNHTLSNVQSHHTLSSRRFPHISHSLLREDKRFFHNSHSLLGKDEHPSMELPNKQTQTVPPSIHSQTVPQSIHSQTVPPSVHSADTEHLQTPMEHLLSQEQMTRHVKEQRVRFEQHKQQMLAKHRMCEAPEEQREGRATPLSQEFNLVRVPALQPVTPILHLRGDEEVRCSTLAGSKLRVASVENYSKMAVVTVLFECGIRYETEEEQGLSILLNKLSFKSSKKYTSEMVRRWYTYIIIIINEILTCIPHTHMFLRTFTYSHILFTCSHIVTHSHIHYLFTLSHIRLGISFSYSLISILPLHISYIFTHFTHHPCIFIHSTIHSHTLTIFVITTLAGAIA